MCIDVLLCFYMKYFFFLMVIILLDVCMYVFIYVDVGVCPFMNESMYVYVCM